LRLFAGHPAKVTLGSNNKMSSLVIVANLSAAIETARVQILAARSCDRGDAGGGKITGRAKNGRCICRCAAPISSNEPADIKPVQLDDGGGAGLAVRISVFDTEAPTSSDLFAILAVD